MPSGMGLMEGDNTTVCHELQHLSLLCSRDGVLLQFHIEFSFVLFLFILKCPVFQPEQRSRGQT